VFFAASLGFRVLFLFCPAAFFSVRAREDNRVYDCPYVELLLPFAAWSCGQHSLLWSRWVPLPCLFLSSFFGLTFLSAKFVTPNLFPSSCILSFLFSLDLFFYLFPQFDTTPPLS